MSGTARGTAAGNRTAGSAGGGPADGPQAAPDPAVLARRFAEIGEQSRPYGSSMYDLFYEKLPPLVPARLTEEVRERVHRFQESSSTLPAESTPAPSMLARGTFTKPS